MSQTVEVLGTVEKVLGNNNYQVELDLEGSSRIVLCHLGGKMRQFRINVIAGDQVTVELAPPFDKGRITFRGKKEDRAAQKKKAERRPKGRGARRR